MPKRKDVIGDNPLAPAHNAEPVLLPGQDNNPTRGLVKLFGYKLPDHLGRAFKLYCHARDKTASEVLEQLLTEFLDGKKIYPE